MEQVVGEKLAAKLNLGEITSWRLHWLVCDLSNLQRDMTQVRFGTTAADLSSGVFADFLKALQDITRRYAALRWEVQTMLGLDYRDEVQPLFDHLPKHAEYLQESKQVESFLQQKAQQIFDNETKRIQESIKQASQCMM